MKRMIIQAATNENKVNSSGYECNSIEYIVEDELDDLTFSDQRQALREARRIAKEKNKSVRMVEKSWCKDKKVGLMLRSVYVKPDGTFIKSCKEIIPMKRVIRAATEDTYSELERPFDVDGEIEYYDLSKLKLGAQEFREILKSLRETGYDTRNDDVGPEIFDLISEWGQWEALAAATCQAICKAYGKRFDSIREFRVNSDGDYCCVTFRNGERKYYFDRNIFEQGIKDAETGELLFYYNI